MHVECTGHNCGSGADAWEVAKEQDEEPKPNPGASRLEGRVCSTPEDWRQSEFTAETSEFDFQALQFSNLSSSKAFARRDLPGRKFRRLMEMPGIGWIVM